ncbi:unnamed protein product [Linum trigynum]|uniref:RING-type E3 ubiquitin transferase n=1 Tax=Linum trigynum TaxID=586398 RepID=A0AAV2GRU8_9ROSI
MARFSAEDDEGPSNRLRKRLRTSTTSASMNPPPETMTSSAGDDEEAVILSGDENEEEEVDLDFQVAEDEEDDVEWDAEGEEEEIEEEEEEDGDDDEVDDDEDDHDQAEQPGRHTQSAESSRNGSVSVTLTDPEVLDCSVCFDTLTIPVYQCENGHTACSPCCTKMAYKCPSCCLPIGYNRCRAIEKVLESASVPCLNSVYGCREVVTYSKKQAHDKACVYAPCLCPLSGCNFSDSVKQLCEHFRTTHKNRTVRFKYDTVFPAFFTSDHKLLVLQEETEGVLFLLTNSVGNVGNIIKVSCMGPASYKGRFFYEVSAKTEDSSVKFQSFAENVLKKGNEAPTATGGFLLVPASFFGRYKQISIDVCIYNVGTYPSDFMGNGTA